MLPEKEPQFFRSEEVSKPEIELSEEEKALAEKRALRLGALRVAEEMLTKEKGVSLEEKAEIIRNYLEKDFIRKEDVGTLLFYPHRISIEDREKAKEFFLGLNLEKLESTLGKEELDLVFRVISERNNLLKQMEENNLSKEEIEKFVEENGYEMLPRRIRQIFDELKTTSRLLKDLLLCQWGISESEHPDTWKKHKEGKDFVGELKISFLDLKTENKKWQEYSKSETEEEKSIDIQGFEIFDFPGIKGREIIAKVLEVLPKRASSATIERIEFEKKTRPIPESYGFSGTAMATFCPQETRHKIRFFLTSLLEEFDKERIISRERIDYLGNVPFTLGHEWGHALDPRIVDQRDLTLQEQLKMVIDWEKVRREEEEWSSYVLEINNPDKKIEELLKSIESFAKSVAYFLDDPFIFQDLHPRRYEFIANLFKKRFPEFDLEKSFKARLDYNILLDTLHEKEKETKTREN